MKRRTIHRLAVAVALVLGAATGVVAGTERTFVSLGSGLTGGVYHPLGAAICGIVNRHADLDDLYCSVEATPGSVYNLQALERREIDFAIVQADNQSAAVKGEGYWATAPMADLRAVVSLYPEAFTVLARREAGIRTLSDLAGKRVNIGNPGSGSRATWDAVSEGLGVPTAALAAATELPPSSSFDELCEDGIDASVLVVGHPSPRVARAIRECDLVLVPADGPAIATLLQSQPHLVATTIPAATYGTAGDVPTFGGRATLVTRADVPAPVVEAVARAVMANIFTLRDMVPVMAMVRPAEMVTQSLTAPLHPGAVKAFQDLSLAP